MSQNVDNILAAFARLSAPEKLELIKRVGGGTSERGRPMNEQYGTRDGINTINFAPRVGGRCPTCGK